MNFKESLLRFISPPTKEEIDRQVLDAMPVGVPLHMYDDLTKRVPRHLSSPGRLYVVMFRLEKQGRVYRSDAHYVEGFPELTVRSTYTRLQ